ncbi:MAG: GNAT family N-acetyltransferase [Candidatus Omnitrophota bacterium]|jgi:serine/threonine-protein kinase RsbW|nr:MAG: GNAT family N-acetyltransferase [Candidatus Omnitrophota bacterium]
MNESSKNPFFAAGLTLKTDKKYLPLITGLIREYAAVEGLRKDEIRQLELVTEEACLNVIDHAFEGRNDVTFDILIERRPGQFVIAVEDQGLPFDWQKTESGEGSGFGFLFMKTYTDEFRFLNQGRTGKRLEMIKHFRRQETGECLMDAMLPADGEKAPPDAAVTIRYLHAHEGFSLARCMFRTYGYTYAEHVYFPERIRELLESGLQQSLVGLSPEGEVIAHVAMMKDRVDAKVAEIGQAAVDPRYRGRGLFEKMKGQIVNDARAAGIYGLYSESITAHPYTQKGNHALGATETGFMLAFAPQRFFIKQIDERQLQRLSTVLFYLRVNDEPERTIYLPFHHKSILQRIYEIGKFRRTFIPSPPLNPDMSSNTRIDVKVNSDCGFAFFKVFEFGQDIADVVRVRLRELCVNKIESIYIDLPLSNPATAVYCASLEMLGFFFSGIIPELFDGDVLRLQYLNNVDIDPEKVVVYSDFGKELFHYVLQAKGN